MQRQSYRLKAGALSNMRLVEETLPPPGPGEVSVEVKAIGLNFADIFAIWGLYGATPKEEFIPGLEYAGIVREIGPGVQSFKAGDPVIGVTRFGAYTSHLNIDHRYLLPLPEGWTMEEGASYLVQVLTAYYGLVYLGNLQQGQTVLIHSAAGGVGTFAGRIARQYGCFTIGTIGSEKKIDYLRQEGYNAWIVRRPASFRQDLERALAGRPLEIIMECIGGKIFRIGFDMLAPMGRQVVYGAARYGSVGNRPKYLRLISMYLTRPRIDPQKLPEKNKGLLGFNLIWLYDRVEIMHRILQELEQLDLGKPVVGEVFAFANLPDSILRFQSGETVGKVVVTL